MKNKIAAFIAAALLIVLSTASSALSYSDATYFGKYSSHTTSWRNQYGSGHEYDYTYVDAGGSDHIYSASYHPREPWTCIGNGCGRTGYARYYTNGWQGHGNGCGSYCIGTQYNDVYNQIYGNYPGRYYEYSSDRYYNNRDDYYSYY